MGSESVQGDVMQTPKIVLTSAYRYNGGVARKRLSGSSTVTEFYVTIDGVLQPGRVTGYGRTPGDRKTYARKVVEAGLKP